MGVRSATAIALLVVAVTAAATDVAFDPNFDQTSYVVVDNQITGIAWAPDGSNRLFVARKTGQVREFGAADHPLHGSR